MILIIGGAYQGKLDYAKAAFGLTDDDVFTCTGAVDFSRRCVYGLEEFVLARIWAGESAVSYFEETKEQWQECILICQDMSGGVVPVSREERAWRQETGRCKLYGVQQSGQSEHSLHHGLCAGLSDPHGRRVSVYFPRDRLGRLCIFGVCPLSVGAVARQSDYDCERNSRRTGGLNLVRTLFCLYFPYALY